jgi:hypothetical protein
MQGEGGALGVAGDVAAAAVALAGLVLVFLGALAASFESYEPQEKRSVRGRFQLRAWFSFVGFALALISATLGIIAKWLQIECAALGAIWILFLAFLLVLAAAVIAIRDIR